MQKLKAKKKAFLIGAACLLLPFLLLGLFLISVLVTLPDFTSLSSQFPHIEESKQGETQIVLRPHRPATWADYENVSKVARAAIRISEDWAFFHHEGLDFREMQKSLKKNIREKRYARGASTITQQVVRNLYLSKEKTLRRKVREIIYAYYLEKEVSKKRIFEIYLNIAEWGEGIYGISEAAEIYFWKRPQSLNAKEACFLAMLLPSPKRYSVSFREQELTPYAEKTIRNLLDKLQRAGYLTEEEREIEETRFLF